MRELPGPRYYDDPADWERIISLCRGRRVGFDTEFYGADLSRTSHQTCPGRARVHVFSIGIPTKVLHPRGFYRAVSAVFPAVAMQSGVVQSWLTDANSIKVGLNAPVDIHATEATAGVRVAGCVDLLSTARWVWPGRVAPGPGFSLDALGSDICGRGKLDSFEEVLGEPNEIEVERRKTSHRMVCSCGASPCRKRTGPEHTREKQTTIERWVERVVRGTRLIPLETVVPGHPRHARLVAYSGVDAEIASELDQVIIRELPRAQERRPNPW